MRRFVRHPTDIPIDISVICVGQHEDIHCAMTDVSQGGLSCLVDHAVSVGSFVDVCIHSVSPEYHGQGQVVWCHSENDQYEIGVKFASTNEAFKARMVQQVCQIEHYKNIIYEREGRLLDGNQAAAEWIAKCAADF